ncbi:hypothetical protein DFH09DRAFT_1328950 [Mycena vulgaris]|nr:hypothetical protein DFH09DRAFT_1328950 [Mycena vulgaris]
MSQISADDMPDEIMSEIIVLAVRPSNGLQDFFSSSRRPSFRVKELAVLSVSKRWTRIASPFIYEMITLRSRAQATALASAVAGNAQLGLLIKKLMVCGGFGSAMKTILALAPNLRTIRVTLELHSRDSVTGLLGGLPLLSPTELVLHPNEITQGPLGTDTVLNGGQRTLLAGIVACISSRWTTLTVFHCPRTIRNPRDSDDTNLESVGAALATAPALERVHIGSYTTVPEFVQALAINPSLRQIAVSETKTRTSRKFRRQVKKDGRLSSLVTYLT